MNKNKIWWFIKAYSKLNAYSKYFFFVSELSDMDIYEYKYKAAIYTKLLSLLLNLIVFVHHISQFNY